MAVIVFMAAARAPHGSDRRAAGTLLPIGVVLGGSSD
jgi:hypothetical protein